MPARTVCLTDCIQHRIVFALYINPEAPRIIRTRNVRWIYVVDKRGHQQHVIIPDDVRISRWPGSELTKFANGVCGIVRSIDTNREIEFVPQRCVPRGQARHYFCEELSRSLLISGLDPV